MVLVGLRQDRRLCPERAACSVSACCAAQLPARLGCSCELWVALKSSPALLSHWGKNSQAGLGG